MSQPPRYLPNVALPPYSYVTGRFPHPLRDPQGHSYRRELFEPTSLPEEDAWQECGPYLYGIDLFNHGYYWEAHEIWEGLWIACGRTGTAADFLKGLIKLAAAGVKARERRAEGVRRHAERAHELFAQTAQAAGSRYWGLDLDGLQQKAAALVASPPLEDADSEQAVVVLFPFRLLPVQKRAEDAQG